MQRRTNNVEIVSDCVTQDDDYKRNVIFSNRTLSLLKYVCLPDTFEHADDQF